MPSPAPILAASSPKPPQVDHPNIKTEQDPTHEAINSIPPITPITPVPKEENQPDRYLIDLKKSIAADFMNAHAPPIPATIEAGERALQQLGIHPLPSQVGVWEGTPRPVKWDQTPGIPGMNTTYLDSKSREHFIIQCQKHLKYADTQFDMAARSEYSRQLNMKQAYKAALLATASPSYTYQEHKERFRKKHYDEKDQTWSKEANVWGEEAARWEKEEKARQKEEEEEMRREYEVEMARRVEERVRRKEEEIKIETGSSAFILRPGSLDGICEMTRGQERGENKRKREEEEAIGERVRKRLPLGMGVPSSRS